MELFQRIERLEQIMDENKEDWDRLEDLAMSLATEFDDVEDIDQDNTQSDEAVDEKLEADSVDDEKNNEIGQMLGLNEQEEDLIINKQEEIKIKKIEVKQKEEEEFEVVFTDLVEDIINKVYINMNKVVKFISTLDSIEKIIAYTIHKVAVHKETIVMTIITLVATALSTIEEPYWINHIMFIILNRMATKEFILVTLLIILFKMIIIKINKTSTKRSE